MSRHSLVATLAIALIIPSVPRAQNTQPAVPQVATNLGPSGTHFGPSDSARLSGTGPYVVWVGEPQGNQSFPLGNAASLVWQNSNGLTVQPTSAMSGSVHVYFAANDFLVQSAVRQSCVALRNCAGPGWPVVMFTQPLLGGSVKIYTASAATIVSLSAGTNGGGAAVITFQRVFIQTLPSATAQPQPPASQVGRINAASGGSN